MFDAAKITGLIRTAIAILSGALIGAGFDVGADLTSVGDSFATIAGAIGSIVAAGWSVYNKVAHREEVEAAATTGKAVVTA